MEGSKFLTKPVNVHWPWWMTSETSEMEIKFERWLNYARSISFEKDSYQAKKRAEKALEMLKKVYLDDRMEFIQILEEDMMLDRSEQHSYRGKTYLEIYENMVRLIPEDELENDQPAETEKDNDSDVITDIRDRITAYVQRLNEEGQPLNSVLDLPLNTSLVHVYVRIYRLDDGASVSYHLLTTDQYRVRRVQNIEEGMYKSSGVDEECFIYSPYQENLMAEINVAPIPMEELVVTVSLTGRHEILKQFAENKKGFWGKFRNYPEEQAALLFATLNDAERQLLKEDPELLHKIGSKLSSAQFAKGLENFDYSLLEKLHLLWETRGVLQDRHIEFQDIRSLLLKGGPEGMELHDRIAEAVSVSTLLRIDWLILDQDPDANVDSIISEIATFLSKKEKLGESVVEPGDYLNVFLESQKRVYGIKSLEDTLIYDDLSEDFAITLTASELEVVNRIIKEQKGKDEISGADKEVFLRAYKRNAVKEAFQLLALSEKAVTDANGALLLDQVDVITDIFKDYEEDFTNLNNQANQLKGLRSNGPRHLVPSYEEQLKKDTDKLIHHVVDRAPILADAHLNVLELYNDFHKDKDTSELKNFLLEHLGEKFDNIQETRRILRREPEQIFKLEGLVKHTNQVMDLGGVFDELVKEEVNRIEWNERLFSIGMAALSIGLALTSFGTLTPLATAIVATSGFAVSAADFYFIYEDYQFKSTTGNTAIDPKNALSFADPSIIWVIASFAGAVADLNAVIKLGKLTKFAKTGEGAQELAEEIDNMRLLNKIDQGSDAAKQRLLSIHQGKVINLKEIDELADIYVAEKFDKLKELKNIDDFLPSDLDLWYKNRVRVVKELSADTHKFLDETLEDNYTTYLARKAKEGKPPRSRLDREIARDYFLNDSPMARGNAFNDKAKETYRYNELQFKAKW